MSWLPVPAVLQCIQFILQNKTQNLLFLQNVMVFCMCHCAKLLPEHARQSTQKKLHNEKIMCEFFVEVHFSLGVTAINLNNKNLNIWRCSEHLFFVSIKWPSKGLTARFVLLISSQSEYWWVQNISFIFLSKLYVSYCVVFLEFLDMSSVAEAMLPGNTCI